MLYGAEIWGCNRNLEGVEHTQLRALRMLLVGPPSLLTEKLWDVVFRHQRSSQLSMLNPSRFLLHPQILAPCNIVDSTSDVISFLNIPTPMSPNSTLH